MKITTTKNIQNANAVTHGGVFHADEVMATAILGRMRELSVCRCSRVPEGLSDQVLVYDIGGGKYDHHQAGGNGARDNGVPYAACGLIWRDFGRELIESEHLPPAMADALWQMVDERLIQGVDAADNGVEVPACALNISGVIAGFNPVWDSSESADEAFLRAVRTASVILENTLRSAASMLRARQAVSDAIAASRDHTMVLTRFLPWKEAVMASEDPRAKDIWFVLFPSTREGWCCQCVPERRGSNAFRHPLPRAWLGLNGEALRSQTGVESALFCHPGGFIFGAKTREDTLRLARIAGSCDIPTAEPAENENQEL